MAQQDVTAAQRPRRIHLRGNKDAPGLVLGLALCGQIVASRASLSPEESDRPASNGLRSSGRSVSPGRCWTVSDAAGTTLDPKLQTIPTENRPRRQRRLLPLL